MGDENPIRTLRDFSKPSHGGYRNTIELPVGNNVVPLRSDTIRLVQNGCSFHRLRSDSPHDTQYCMEDPQQAFVEYASSRIDEAGEGLVSNFMASQDARLTKFETDFKQQQSEMTNKIDIVLKAISDRIKQSDSYDEKAKENEKEEKDSPENIHINPSTPADLSVAFITKKFLKFNSFFESLRLVPQSSDTKVIYTKRDDGEVMFIELIRKNDDSSDREPEGEGSLTTEGVGAVYFDIFPTRSELTYHKYLMCSPIPSIFLRNPIIIEGCPSKLKIPYNIRHVHVEKAYIDPKSTLNIMTRMMYNWIMRRKLDPRENSNRGVSSFTGRIKGMHVFVGNFTYIVDFMIVEDISLIIDPRLSKVVLWKPFVEISNMTHDPPEGVVRFTNGTDEVAYKMTHMIEQYNSLSGLEKKHTKLVYLRNKEDKRRGVEKAYLLEDKQIPSVGVFDEVSFCTLFRGRVFGSYVVALHDALRALVDLLLVAMLTKGESLESDSEREGSEDEGPDFEEEEAAPEGEGWIYDHTQRLDALPPTLFEGYDRYLKELYTRSRAVKDEVFSMRYRLRSLEQEHERATVTFDAIWRLVLALEAWAGQTDA
ncbi:hypothetical protein Tco_0268532 [Tanacetum coccineum]